MIDVRLVDEIALITIDRRDLLNALDTADTLALERAVALAGAGPARAIVITGAGEKSFVAGGDLDELAGEASVADALDLPMPRALHAVAHSRIPTVAAVNGYALGGGLELALACDIRVASPNATFALPELQWSMLPAAGGVTRLTKLVGPGRALELILTGRRFDAAEALALGVVTAVADDGDVVALAIRTARLVLTKGPAAVRVARMAVRLATDSGTEAGLTAEMLGLALLYGSDDRVEGVRSFREKRSPRFTGR